MEKFTPHILQIYIHEFSNYLAHLHFIQGHIDFKMLPQNFLITQK